MPTCISASVYALQAPKNISEGQLVASGLVHLVQVVARGVGVFALDGLQEILEFVDDGHVPP